MNSLHNPPNRIAMFCQKMIFGLAVEILGILRAGNLLIDDEDLIQMYLKHKRGEIHLWYNKDEIKVEELEPPSKRTKEGNGCTRRQEKEKKN